MSFASRSHPDYALEGESHPADHAARLEYLREKAAEMARKPDAIRPEVLPCPKCSELLSITLGRNSGAFFITHPPSRACSESRSMWRVNAADRQTAIQLWSKEVEL